MSLSKRGSSAEELNNSLTIWKILADQWSKSNPGGYVSLGVAENTLMHEELCDHITKHFQVASQQLTYGDGPAGSHRLRDSMARFLTKYLKPATPIKRNDITVTNGCTSAIEHMSWAFSNPGEGFLLGQPHYGAFETDITFRTESKLVQVPFGSGVDPVSVDCVAKYEASLSKAREAGTKVVGLFLCNPHNPLGRCYSRETLVELMKFCQRNNLHLISDEIYALSVWENTVDTDPAPNPFTSVLSIDPDGLIDASRIHVLWGMSKDFGANGLRLGAIISQHNPSLASSLSALAIYSSASSLTDVATANLLEDEQWVESYVIKNRKLLSENYAIVTRWAKDNDIEYLPGVNAAFFLWVNLGKAYKTRHASSEDIGCAKLDKLLLDQRIFLASGLAFGSEADGWFRIVFTHKKEFLMEGLKRVVQAMGVETAESQLPKLTGKL
ncbi:PLP-dependent transferase [Piedraia hortae CBS 480.64]|uniref:PLP-dependent transferase n=1 Tax=Piedraia hortae CBS 480.64 TaxID=1314780 RepID=A0A6A7C2N5_9PEZI|nr:PLP-dependent transferase [Piedraia hortae CBS 480.64]